MPARIRGVDFSFVQETDGVHGDYCSLCFQRFEREFVRLLFRQAFRIARRLDHAGTGESIFLFGMGVSGDDRRDLGGLENKKR